VHRTYENMKVSLLSADSVFASLGTQN